MTLNNKRNSLLMPNQFTYVAEHKTVRNRTLNFPRCYNSLNLSVFQDGINVEHLQLHKFSMAMRMNLNEIKN